MALRALTFLFPLLLAAAAAPAFPEDEETRLSAGGSIPVLAWIGPPPDQSTTERFVELAEAGFTHSFTPHPGADSMAAALDAAGRAGVQLLIACPELREAPEATVERFKHHPANGGYYLRDEPGAADFPALAEWLRRIQSADATRTCYINLFPTYASETQLGTPTYEEYLNRFAAEVPVPVLSFDHYPVLATGFRKDFYRNLELVAAKARETGKPFWAFALSVKHGPYPVPRAGHLRLEVNSALAHGAAGIQYFTYWAPGAPEEWPLAPVDAGGTLTPVYGRVKRVNAELRSLSPVFYGAKALSIGHAGPVPEGCRAYEPAWPVSAVIPGESGALVSTLEKEGRRFLAVVNRDHEEPRSVRVELAAPGLVRRVEGGGRIGPPEGKAVELALEPGGMLILTWMPGEGGKP